MEYGNVAISASVTQLSRLDTVQNAAATLYHAFFIPLQCRHHAYAGLLLKLLDCHCRELLLTFCPNFSTSNLTLCRSSRLTSYTQPYLMADIIVYNSLDLFQQSFLGSIPEIWQNEVPICLHQDSHSFGWQTVCKDIQHVICRL